tara:strand:- start:34 stop:300 length:267 start_codon:yes stop_codon:yes gene_type:complete
MKRKLDKEHLESIKNLREQFTSNANILGNITLERELLKEQLEQLNNEKTKYFDEFINLRKTEEELLSKLKKRYGDGQIDINEGTFIPS